VRHVQAKSNANTTRSEEAPPLEAMGRNGNGLGRRIWLSIRYVARQIAKGWPSMCIILRDCVMAARMIHRIFYNYASVITTGLPQRKMAGLAIKLRRNMHWTKERCIEELKAVSVDGVVSSSAAARRSKSLPTMAYRHFGNFKAACEAAGLKSISEARRRYDICQVAECKTKVRGCYTAYCEMHYGRIRRNGTTEKICDHPKPWRLHTHGYILLYESEHPLAQSNGYVYEHRKVFYDAYGDGPFVCHWCDAEVGWANMHVDHVNGRRDDNALDNLAPSCARCNQARGIPKMRESIRQKQGVWIECFGRRQTLVDWAEELSISPQAVSYRLKSGWPIEKALSEPRGKYGPKGKRSLGL
jgi:hypothetical protein